MTISEISSRFQLKMISRRNIFWLSKKNTLQGLQCMWSRVFAKYSLVVNFMSCNTVKTCACLIQGKIFGGIIKIYHACKWSLLKNTGWESRQIALAYRLGKFVQSLNQYFLAKTTYKHGIFLYKSCQCRSTLQWVDDTIGN